MDVERLEDPPALIVRPRGTMSTANFRDWGRALRAHALFEADLHQIIDLSQVDFSALRRADIDRMVAMAAALDYGPTTCIALVADENLRYGFSRMYEIVASDGVPRLRAVFRTLDEAVAWVRTEHAHLRG